MSSFQSNSNNTVEVDGIQLQTVMPEHVVQIPPKQPGAKTQVQFGIQITNNTTNSRNLSEKMLPIGGMAILNWVHKTSCKSP